ncbi:MAG: hypothetical protein ABEH38_09390 [Flavobacteriales bacterium]
MGSEGPNETNSQNWGQRIADLFHRTWEMELLLFGFVIVLIWQVPDRLFLLDQKLELIHEANAGLINFLRFLLGVLRYGVIIAIVGMIVHLALRGFWIAVVGLQSVFPEGAYYSRLKLNKEFQRHFQKEVKPLDKFEEKLEQICSANFAVTFLIFFTWWAIMASIITLSGFQIFIVAPLVSIIPLPEGWDITFHLFFSIAFALMLLTYATDFFLNGKLKQIKAKWFAIPYFYWYKFMNGLTLSFLYRPLYYTFITRSTRKLLPFLVAALVFIFFAWKSTEFNSRGFFPDRQIESHYLSSAHYTDELPPERLIMEPVIPSKKVSQRELEFFIPYDTDIYNKNRLETDCPSVEPLKAFGFNFFMNIDLYGIIRINIFNSEHKPKPIKEKVKDRKNIIKCIKNTETVFIDSMPVRNIDHKFYRHKRNNVPGFLTYIPLRGIDPGWHELILDRSGDSTHIPFYYGAKGASVRSAASGKDSLEGGDRSLRSPLKRGDPE